MRIFLVDDEKAVLKLLECMVRDFGHKPESFNEPDRALSAIIARPPDLVVTDITMPGMDGYQLMSEVEKKGLKTPFLLMSGNTTSLRENTHILSKPFDEDTFSLAIQQVAD